MEKPVINSLFGEPKRHFRFAGEGATGFDFEASHYKVRKSVLIFGFTLIGMRWLAQAASPGSAPHSAISVIDPPESGFFAKRLDYKGIPIKAPSNVVDEALFAAYDRLSMNLPLTRPAGHPLPVRRGEGRVRGFCEVHGPKARSA